MSETLDFRDRCCRSCKKNVIKSLKTCPEQICKECLRHLTRTYCQYCKKDFHQLKGQETDPKQARCLRCDESYKAHGSPKACAVCEAEACFGEEEERFCRHCKKSKERYGDPIMCDQCLKTCAYKKPEDKRREVGNQDLCFICTREFKLNSRRASKEKRKKEEMKREKQRTEKRKRQEKKEERKRRKVAAADHTRPTDNTVELEERITALNAELETIRKERERDRTALASATRQLEAQKITVAKLRREIAKADEVIGQIKGQQIDTSQGLEREITKAREQGRAQLTQAKKSYQKAQRKLEERIRELEDRNQKLEEENSNLKG